MELQTNQDIDSVWQTTAKAGQLSRDHYIEAMAEDREPPPMQNEPDLFDDEEDDDIFKSTSSQPVSKRRSLVK